MTAPNVYAVLGSTGNCGSALIDVLLRRPDVRINAYCRDRNKLLKKVPKIAGDDRVNIFEGSINDISLLAACTTTCRAVFLCVSTNDNVPGCRVAQDTAVAVIQALRQRKDASGSGTKATNLPKLVLLSSGTIDEQFSRHVPWLLLPILVRSASYVYQDLIATENLLRSEEAWLTSIYMKPGALAVDRERGYALSLCDQDGPTSYLDLATGMIEAVEESQGLYDGKSVSTICTNGPAAFPSGTPLCIVTGLLRHYFPWLHGYLPMNTGPK